MSTTKKKRLAPKGAGTPTYRAIARAFVGQATSKALEEYFALVAVCNPRGSSKHAVNAFAAEMRARAQSMGWPAS